MILLRVELYLEGAEVHVFIMEVSTFCQFWKMAFGEVKSEKYTDSLVSRLSLSHTHTQHLNTVTLWVMVTTKCVHRSVCMHGCVCVCVLTFSHFWPSCWPCCCCRSAWGALPLAQGSLHSWPKHTKMHQYDWSVTAAITQINPRKWNTRHFTQSSANKHLMSYRFRRDKWVPVIYECSWNTTTEISSVISEYCHNLITQSKLLDKDTFVKYFPSENG